MSKKLEVSKVDEELGIAESWRAGAPSAPSGLAQFEGRKGGGKSVTVDSRAWSERYA